MAARRPAASARLRVRGPAPAPPVGRLAALAPALAALVAAAALVAGRASAEEAVSDVGETREAALAALAEGDRLRGEARCPDAIAAWRQGLRETGHWVFLARIGDCYRREGDHQRALAYFRRALEQGGEDLAPSICAEIEAAIESEMARMPAVLQVAATAPSAEVYVDGTDEGEAPVTLEVPPGARLVAAEREGYRGHTMPVSVQPGRTVSVVIPLEEEEGAAPSAPEEDREEPRHPRRRVMPSDLAAGLMIAAGAILLGAGLGVAIWDASPLEDRSYFATEAFGPALGGAALGVGLAIGGIVLIALPPRWIPVETSTEEDR